VGYDIESGKINVGLAQFSSRWANLIDTTEDYYGTQFYNFCSRFVLAFLRSPASRVNHSYPDISISKHYSSSPVTGRSRARVLYNIPFQIPAEIALSHMRNRSDGGIILLAICLWLVAISIRSVSNFHLVLPH
jgi:hypothetical protein